MVLTVNVPVKKAQEFKNYLIGNNMFDKARGVESDESFVYYPDLNIDSKILNNKFETLSFIQLKLIIIMKIHLVVVLVLFATLAKAQDKKKKNNPKKKES